MQYPCSHCSRHHDLIPSHPFSIYPMRRGLFQILYFQNWLPFCSPWPSITCGAERGDRERKHITVAHDNKKKRDTTNGLWSRRQKRESHHSFWKEGAKPQGCTVLWPHHKYRLKEHQLVCSYHSLQQTVTKPSVCLSAEERHRNCAPFCLCWLKRSFMLRDSDLRSESPNSLQCSWSGCCRQWPIEMQQPGLLVRRGGGGCGEDGREEEIRKWMAQKGRERAGNDKGRGGSAGWQGGEGKGEERKTGWRDFVPLPAPPASHGPYHFQQMHIECHKCGGGEKCIDKLISEQK